MARVPVFYSFHYGNDVFRVQQIRNMGAIDGNAPVSKNEWETVKRGGNAAIERWIDENMKYRRCVIVLIGAETATRPWVRHEIVKAWNEKRGLLGIHIHGIKCMINGTCGKGPDPFNQIKFTDGTPMSRYINTYDPMWDPYNQIKSNLDSWVNAAVEQARSR